MSPALANTVALAVSASHSHRAKAYAETNLPRLALKERALAVVTYDRVLLHWSYCDSVRDCGLDWREKPLAGV